MKKSPLTTEQQIESKALKALWDGCRRDLRLTQQLVADQMGNRTQGAVSHYLNGENALNLEAALIFSKMMNVPIEKFSPRLSLHIQGVGAATIPESLQVLAIMSGLTPEDRRIALEIVRAYAKRETPQKTQ